MTRSELIKQCYKIYGLDPEKNPQALSPLVEWLLESQQENVGVPAGWDKLLELFAEYIDAQD
jgi:hypothetical protein